LDERDMNYAAESVTYLHLGVIVCATATTPTPKDAAMPSRIHRTMDRPSFADVGSGRYAIARMSWLAGERGRRPI